MIVAANPPLPRLHIFGFKQRAFQSALGINWVIWIKIVHPIATHLLERKDRESNTK